MCRCVDGVVRDGVVHDNRHPAVTLPERHMGEVERRTLWRCAYDECGALNLQPGVRCLKCSKLRESWECPMCGLDNVGSAVACKFCALVPSYEHRGVAVGERLES